MKLVPLNTIFFVEYGNQLDYSKMTPALNGGVNFISRSSKKFGIVGKVEEEFSQTPYEAGLITVCLGGSILESFVQPEQFYTAQNIKILTPQKYMSFNEKLFYCLCIKANRFRYSTFGREANVTIDTLLIPNKMPLAFSTLSLNRIESDVRKAVSKKTILLNTHKWKEFRLDELFKIEKGERILNRDMQPGTTPCVRATALNNGITAFIAHEPNHEGGTISVSYNGSIGEAFYQEKPFFALDDVNVLYPIDFELNQYSGMFFCSLIRKERFRFNYGRKWNLERMNETIIRIPVNKTNSPDIDYIEAFIKGLPFSASI